jgi:hypothetical protein
MSTEWKPIYALQITEADHEANEFRCLGGAAWPTKAMRDEAYASIPESETSDRSTDDFTWIVDLLDDDGFSIIGDKEVDEWVVLKLLDGDSIEGLRTQAIEREAAAMAEAGRILEAQGEPNPYAQSEEVRGV